MGWEWMCCMSVVCARALMCGVRRYRGAPANLDTNVLCRDPNRAPNVCPKRRATQLNALRFQSSHTGFPPLCSLQAALHAYIGLFPGNPQDCRVPCHAKAVAGHGQHQSSEDAQALGPGLGQKKWPEGRGGIRLPSSRASSPTSLGATIRFAGEMIADLSGWSATAGMKW